jgi:hypothetical protein
MDAPSCCALRHVHLQRGSTRTSCQEAQRWLSGRACPNGRETCKAWYELHRQTCLRQLQKVNRIIAHQLAGEGGVEVVDGSLVGVPGHSSIGCSICCAVECLQGFAYPALRRGHRCDSWSISSDMRKPGVGLSSRLSSRHNTLWYLSAVPGIPSRTCMDCIHTINQIWRMRRKTIDIARAVFRLFFCEFSVDCPLDLTCLLQELQKR